MSLKVRPLANCAECGAGGRSEVGRIYLLGYFHYGCTIGRMKAYLGLLGLLVCVQASPLAAQQIPADELPPPGTDTGLDGKYDPQNGIAQLIRGEDKDVA